MKQYTKSVRGKLFKYFEQRLNIKKSTKGWYRCDCKYCGGKFSFGINLKENKVHCFKCEIFETPIKTLMFLEGFETFSQAYNFLKVQDEFERYDEEAAVQIEKKDVKLPEGYKLLNPKAPSYLGVIAYNYLIHTRKFNLGNLIGKGVGYCTSGEYRGYIIFPYYKFGKLVFFQGRKFNDWAFTKMKNPPLEEFGIGKSDIFYNADALYIYRKINLVESVTNALTLGNNTIASSGKSLSPKQIKDIIMAPCKYINIILDDDAYEKALDLALLLSDFKKVKITKMPFEKDVNDIGKLRTMKLAKKAIWGNYNYFWKEKLNYAENTFHTYN